jgi:hypothetical protein
LANSKSNFETAKARQTHPKRGWRRNKAGVAEESLAEEWEGGFSGLVLPIFGAFDPFLR